MFVEFIGFLYITRTTFPIQDMTGLPFMAKLDVDRRESLCRKNITTTREERFFLRIPFDVSFRDIVVQGIRGPEVADWIML